MCIPRHLRFSVGSDCDFLVYCVILYINIYDRKSFDYETSITGKLEKNDGGKDIKIAITYYITQGKVEFPLTNNAGIVNIVCIKHKLHKIRCNKR